MTKRQDEQKMHRFKATVVIRGQREEVPVWGRTIEEAHDAAELEYGSVERIRKEVNQ